jgi:hypothetical protein
LRGLRTDARCPECGVPVDVSVNGDLLRFSDPKYVAKLHQGIRLMLWAILVDVLEIAAVFIVGLGGIMSSRVSSTGAQLLAWGALVLNFIGAWLLTTPDPSGVAEDRYGTSRKVVRFALFASLLNNAVSVVDQVPFPPTVNATFRMVTALCALAVIVGLFAQLQYLEKLALRLPDQSLSNRARDIKWGFSITLTAIVLFGILFIILGRGSAMILGSMAVIAGIVLLAYAIMYLFLLGGFSGALAESAELAREVWRNAM